MKAARTDRALRARWALIALVALAAWPPAARADNDDFENALPLGYGIVGTAANNSAATIQSGTAGPPYLESGTSMAPIALQ